VIQEYGNERITIQDFLMCFISNREFYICLSVFIRHRLFCDKPGLKTSVQFW